MRPTSARTLTLSLRLALLLLAGPARAGVAEPLPPAVPAPSAAATPAPGPPQRAWQNTADLGIVMTSGNTSNTNVALNDLLQYRWSQGTVELKVRALRIEDKRTDVSADFTDPEVPRLVVSESRARTTDQYDAVLRVTRQVHERFGWFSYLRWEQDRPKGLQSRSSAGGGASYTVSGTPQRLVRLEAGLDAIRESSVTADRDSIGLRLASRYERDVSGSTRLLGAIEAFDDLRDTSHVRFNADAAIAVAINSRFALKTGANVRYDRRPPPRVFSNPAGGPDAIYEYRTTDTVLSTSLVMKF